MTWPLDIIRCGAVTPVGLTARQTCAALRAGISAFGDAFQLSPLAEPIICATVPARLRLKSSSTDWLVNLATRAIGECLTSGDDLKKTALILVLPEPYRNHPAFLGCNTSQFFSLLEARLGVQFSKESVILQNGHAGALHGVDLAANLIKEEKVLDCIVGGVDSMINKVDIDRLQDSHRLSGPENAQGVIPGESAAFIRLTAYGHGTHAMAHVLGVGFGVEKDIVLSDRYSQGRGLFDALEQAINIASISEEAIAFRVSDMNGERYRAWESLISECRFYRTRREKFPGWYAAASLGDIGAATSALLIITASVGIFHGYSPGDSAMCEASSDKGLRGACVVGSVVEKNKTRV